jgi:nucleoside-diphosphate-sugar epimerase
VVYLAERTHPAKIPDPPRFLHGTSFRDTRALTDDGHDVTALTRHPGDYTGAGRAVYADIGDADSLRRALDGQEAAYYLVHSLAGRDFPVRDREGANVFAAAAAGAGLSQVVYLSVSVTIGMTCPSTFAADARSNRSSATGPRRPPFGPASSSATGASAGRSCASSWSGSQS